VIKLANGKFPRITTTEYDDELIDLCHRMLSTVCGRWEKLERGGVKEVEKIKKRKD
jgi:hypothetical protein